MAPLLIIVDDDEDDRMLMIDFLFSMDGAPNAIFLTNGNELMDFLSGRHIPIKNICITLDMNMPGMTGVEILNVLKAHPHYRDIPVSIITTSSDTNLKTECM